MTVRIGRLHGRFRVAANSTAAPVPPARLGRELTTGLADSLEAACAATFGDDQAVYVFRRVCVALACRTNRGFGPLLAQQIARTLEFLLNGAPADVVRFADQAEFVASFATDLLDGVAWDHWHYGAFRRYSHLDVSGAILAVLLDHRRDLPRILSLLAARRRFEPLLTALSATDLQRLWIEGVRGQLPGTRDQLRPIVAAALELADRLSLWRGPRPDSEALLAACASRIVLAGRWGDPVVLARSVLAVIQRLHAEGRLHPPAFGLPVDELSAEFDWLDRPTLLDGLQKLPDASDVPEPVRLLFTAAVRLGERLDLWDLPQERVEELCRQFAQRHPSRIDWQDRSALAVVVAAAFRFVLGAMGVQAEFRAADLVAHCAVFDWLDVERLVRLLEGQPTEVSPWEAVAELLGDLKAVLRDGVRLEYGQPASPTHLLRWHQALVQRAPRWGYDSRASECVQRLLEAWTCASRRPAAVLAALRRGEAAAAATLADCSDDLAAVEALRTVCELGEPGIEVLEELVRPAAFPQGGCFETPFAGLFLLLRAILDARLDRIVVKTGFPSPEPSGVRMLLLAVARRWAGSDAIDPAVELFAGAERGVVLADVRSAWAERTAADHEAFQAALLRPFASQRLLDPHRLHVHLLSMSCGHTALVGGDGSARVWPLGQVLRPDETPHDVLARWLNCWERTLGVCPVVVGSDEVASAEVEPSDRDAHRSGEESLRSALGVLEGGKLGLAQADLTVALLSVALLRVWSRWLRSMANASPARLLDAFIRRPGRVACDASTVTVWLDRHPLNAILQMAGYTATTDAIAWLHGRRVRFVLGGGRP